MNAIVSEKGQVTIPKPLRDDLGLAAGSVLSFAEENGRIVATKVLASDPLSAWRGRAKLPRNLSVDDYIQTIRNGQ
jgi:AbrB family looped-hinge helix DNA binding protein